MSPTKHTLVQEESCPRVVLIGPAEPDTYALPKQIVVRRRVLIMGHPFTLPVLDASLFPAERAIRVAVRPHQGAHFRLKPYVTIPIPLTHAQEGGYLDLRFVRIKPGAGIVRDRYGLEGQDLRSKVHMHAG